MAKTVFESLQSLLKSHPETRPASRPHRTSNKPAAALESFTRPPALDRHRRKCQICRHPHRREIESDFLRWRSLREIAKSFGIADPTSIWRHACATALREKRERRIAYALHPILEQSEEVFVTPTPSAIISAVRTYSQINDEGRRRKSKPVTHVYYVNESAQELMNPNRNIQELEDDSTN